MYLRYALAALLSIALSLPALAQDSIKYRMILIGDAGEMDPQQHHVIDDAAAHVLRNRTSVFFLGDNVYPRGMGLPGSKTEEAGKKILQSQFRPMRAAGAPVYFIPGNHDWDRMGPQGLAKIRQQWAYLASQHDSLLKLVPPDGCPGPVEISLTDSLTVIAFDSEWWLFPFDKANPEADCDCRTKDDVISSLESMAYDDRYKVIVLAAHHPFQSYGQHGGKFSWKDHLFPLTALNKNLYLPLPGVGSLYPFLRTVFTNPEDLKHPLYRDMIRRIDGAFAEAPNLVHAAGHEHGLQFIKNKQLQVVSGAGAKHAYARKGKHSLFAKANQGYVTADLLEGNALRFTYYLDGDTGVAPVFSYTEPYVPVKKQEDSAYAAVDTDSVMVRIHPGYDRVSGMHRFLFGENYRKEWAAPAKLPVIRISQVEGGLVPEKRGGGHQTRSLRLVDKQDREWVLRSVEKYPEAILPEQLRETFAKDWVGDNMSAQHPFSALVVPALADAAGIPHTRPVIGWVAPDKALGVYEKTFARTVCLLEQREPLGNSDNTPKMYGKLREDNDNTVDSLLFFRARLLDLLIADWDRHDDQWRWVDTLDGKGKHYIPVPRDRDQVFYTNEGLIPSVISRKWIAPKLQGFKGRIRDVGTFYFNGHQLNSWLLNQLSYPRWMEATRAFVATMTDSVLEAALRSLPDTDYAIRHDELLAKLKQRRDALPEASARYYRFLNRIVDIQTSDKNEQVTFTDTADGRLSLVIRKISKKGLPEQITFARIFDPGVTREIRLFVAGGDDKVTIRNTTSIRLRIVGGQGSKAYDVEESRHRIHVYGPPGTAAFAGAEERRVKTKLSADSANTAIVSTNPYNVAMPLLTGGYNRDDGLMLGAGVRFTQRGFRKTPYAGMQQLTLAHAFATRAYRARYKGEWIEALGHADITAAVNIMAPDNTQNFFGTGNNSVYDKSHTISYYRARFDLYELETALRFKTASGAYFSIGPAFQYYRYDSSENKNRFTRTSGATGTYDSAVLGKAKAHAGLLLNFVSDRRNNTLIPQWGTYVNVALSGFAGLNQAAGDYGRLTAEAALYKSINLKGTLVIGERIGGGIMLGKPAFYQSLFLGGQDNLLGFRKYRFAGTGMLYNNLELRIKLATFNGYILPGQLGLRGFYDVGRVWQKEEASQRWHQGVGGGLYFAPAEMALVSFVMGYSPEGWYPYIRFGFRF
ncbi:BamA/TamA family outer membrane protein [Compostibacter hankyongensis]|uniref:Metallophosphoesterase n=1 Tax=Compostibacter hankyongensis TaxID=1007089 RepID=A0ABP8GAW3_9BACT